MSKKQDSVIGKKFTALRSTTSYATLHSIIVDLLRSSHPSQIPHIRDLIARILQASYNKESSNIKDPKALQAIDQKYGALRVLVRNLTTPRQPVPGTQLASLGNQSKWGSPLVLGTVLTTLGGAFYLFTKYNKKKENPTSSSKPTSGFQKTLKAIQKYKLISQLDFDSNFLEDYESIMKGKVKKIARKKPYSKADAWTREEGDLMREIDSSFKSITTTKPSGYKIPELPEPKGFDPFSILGSTKPKKRETKRPKETPEAPQVIEESFEEPFEETIVETPRKAKKKRPVVNRSPSGERLIPIVKRTKRISKIRT